MLTACTVSAYQIRPNSTLSLIGTAEPIPSNPNPTPRQHQKPRAPEPKTEQSTITQIQTELDRVRQTLEPDVDSFLHTISPSFAHPPTSTYSLHLHYQPKHRLILHRVVSLPRNKNTTASLSSSSRPSFGSTQSPLTGLGKRREQNARRELERCRGFWIVWMMGGTRGCECRDVLCAGHLDW